jgi:hypothetical protein
MVRKKDDFYPTNEGLTKALLVHVPVIYVANTILEPCAGNGAIFDLLVEKAKFAKVFGFDINPDFGYPVADVSQREFWSNFSCDWSGGAPEWVITNPPFKDAHKIIPYAFEVAQVGIAMLLPTSWLQPARGRGEWLEQHQRSLSNLIIFGEPRPSFTGDGKNALCTVCWMVWRKHRSGGCYVHFARNWKQ